MKIVIIGGVAGGATAAGRLRRLNEQAELIMFERGPYISFANCGLPYYISGDITQRDSLFATTPEAFTERYRIDVRIRQEVTRINRADKTLEVMNHATGKAYQESYDTLLISTGAEPIRPSIPGMESERVFTLRTVPDMDAIDQFIRSHAPKTAVVLGGGFTGLEMVESFSARGLSVSVVEKAPQIAAVLDADMVGEVHEYAKAKGVALHLGTGLSTITETENQLLLTLEDGTGLATDLLLVVIGVRPESRLAAEAGLALGVRGAIVTDEHLKTSDDSIYAIGDAVQTRHFVSGRQVNIPLAGPANKQARIVADNICGLDSVYGGPQGSSVLKLFDMQIAVTGLGYEAALAAGFTADFVIVYEVNHAGYYPGAEEMALKVIYDTHTGVILGAQGVGLAGVDKRIDVLATAIRGGMTAQDLTELDLCYAPPFGIPRDAVNLAGYIIENKRDGLISFFHWDEVATLPRDGSTTLLDVRSAEEWEAEPMDGFRSIPLVELRDRIQELDSGKAVYLSCRSGLRSYVAARLLQGHGFKTSSLCGGTRLYHAMTPQG